MIPLGYILGLLVAIGLVYFYLPRLTRPEIYFSVTVPAGFRETADGRQALRRYRLEAVLHTALALAFAAVLRRVNAMAMVTLPLLYLIAAMLHAFFHARSLVRRFAAAPSAERAALLPRPSIAFPGGWIAAAGPFVILALAVRAGHPAAAAWAGPGAVLAVVLGLIYCSVRYSRYIAVDAAAARAELRFRRSVLLLGLFIGYFLALVSAAAWLRPAWVLRLTIAGDLVIAAWIVVLLRMGQGGSRLAPAPAGAPLVGDRTADRYWIGGLIYCNRTDPAVFVEKRFGVGYTLNVARPLAWLLLALLAALAAFAIHFGGRHPRTP